ncbi:MAG: formate dehydrogenase accessory protein FdhE [Desulfotomaculum sp.]|nr:formate dehydrogenase accessory protein FdhE [Desulfotomaculum sp.]
MNAGRLANFYLELVELEEKLSSIEWEEEITEEIKEKWLNGMPVLSQLHPCIHPSTFRDTLLTVVRACLKWQPGPQALSDKIVPAVEKLNDLEISLLAGIIIKDEGNKKEEWSKRLSITAEMMEFLAGTAARLILSSFSSYVSNKVDLEKWYRGYCPVCGDSPVMSKLTGEAGARMLYCGRCETEWRFYRLGCPYCENKDSSQISIIIPDEYKQYRLYLCEKCKSYLKTVDERQCGEVDLFCEDLATTDFDILAAGEGYRRGNERYRA